jgi:hypothetical protein
VGASPKKRATPEYAVVYRSVDHGSLRELCKEIGKTPLPIKYRKYAPASGFNKNIRLFAAGLVELQERRHAADYDPSQKFKISDVSAAISSARSAIETFERAAGDDKRAFLTLLLFRPR